MSANADREQAFRVLYADHSTADGVVIAADARAAMDRLRGQDQEVLQLHLWEQLESREIAQVLGLSTVVVQPRLSRARARLRDLLGNDPGPPGHLSSDSIPQLATQHAKEQ